MYELAHLGTGSGGKHGGHKHSSGKHGGRKHSSGKHGAPSPPAGSPLSNQPAKPWRRTLTWTGLRQEDDITGAEESPSRADGEGFRVAPSMLSSTVILSSAAAGGFGPDQLEMAWTQAHEGSIWWGDSVILTTPPLQAAFKVSVVLFVSAASRHA